jgi:hypothetical protein
MFERKIRTVRLTPAASVMQNVIRPAVLSQNQDWVGRLESMCIIF